MYNNISTAEAEAVTMNAFELAQKGGWLMYVLLILLLMSIYVIERRWSLTRQTKRTTPL